MGSDLRLSPRLQGNPPDRDFSLHKGRGRLVVDRRQSGNVADELVKKTWLQEIGLLGNGGLLGQNNVFSCTRIRGEKTPVDVPPVSEVGVVTVLGGQAEGVLDQVGGVRGTLEEELDDGGQQLELDLGILIMEVLKE